MYFVDKIQAQGTTQRKIPVPKKFWDDFPLKAYVKVSLLDSGLYFVDRIQAQGKIQRRIPVSRKFWKEFRVNSVVRIEVINP